MDENEQFLEDKRRGALVIIWSDSLSLSSYTMMILLFF